MATKMRKTRVIAFYPRSPEDYHSARTKKTMSKNRITTLLTFFPNEVPPSVDESEYITQLIREKYPDFKAQRVQVLSAAPGPGKGRKRWIMLERPKIYYDGPFDPE